MDDTYVYLDEFGNALLVQKQAHETTLSFLQTLVDGWIDVVSNGRFDFVVNDEGLYREDFGINLVATVISKRQLVGPCVVTKSPPEGETRGLSKEEIRYLKLDLDERIYTSEDIATKIASRRES